MRLLKSPSKKIGQIRLVLMITIMMARCDAVNCMGTISSTAVLDVSKSLSTQSVSSTTSDIIIIAYIVIIAITISSSNVNMIHIFTSTKTAPVLVESLADKKVKIGELVELSVAGFHSSKIINIIRVKMLLYFPLRRSTTK